MRWRLETSGRDHRAGDAGRRRIGRQPAAHRVDECLHRSIAADAGRSRTDPRTEPVFARRLAIEGGRSQPLSDVVRRRRGRAAAQARHRRRQPVRQAFDAGTAEGEGAASRRTRGAAHPRRERGSRSARSATSSVIPIARRRKSRGSMRRWRARAARGADRHYRVLPLSRRGWVAGSDSFVGSLLLKPGCSTPPAISASPLAGSRLAQRRRRSRFQFRRRWKRSSSCGPTSSWCRKPAIAAEDDGQAFLLHPALERFYPPEKRIVIPERLTECGGVMLADALDVLTAELKRVGR